MAISKTSWFEMRIEPDVKEQAEQLFYSCGLTMSGAISLFIHQSISTQGLPFTVHAAKHINGAAAQEKD